MYDLPVRGICVYSQELQSLLLGLVLQEGLVFPEQSKAKDKHTTNNNTKMLYESILYL